MESNYVDMSEVIAANKRAGFHFFDESTMRGFRSKVYEPARGGRAERVYFVTSEKRTGFRCEDGPRTYTVRVCDLAVGDIREGSPFEAFATLRAAEKARDRYAAQDCAGERWACHAAVASKIEERMRAVHADDVSWHGSFVEHRRDVAQGLRRQALELEKQAEALEAGCDAELRKVLA